MGTVLGQPNGQVAKVAAGGGWLPVVDLVVELSTVFIISVEQSVLWSEEDMVCEVCCILHAASGVLPGLLI